MREFRRLWHLPHTQGRDSRNLSISIGLSGVTPTAALIYPSRLSSSYTTSIPRPPRTYDGREPCGWIANLVSNLKCLVNSSSHTRFWHRYLKFIHHLTEEISVLCKIDDSRRCTEDALRRSSQGQKQG